MTTALFDVNVILDVLLDRAPHAQASAAVWRLVESATIRGQLSAHAVTTVHYLVQKEAGSARAKQIVASMLRVFEVAPVDAAVIREALELPCPDFEDGVTAAAARRARCDYVITRDPKGFTGSPIRVLTPEAALPLWIGRAARTT